LSDLLQLLAKLPLVGDYPHLTSRSDRDKYAYWS
jgi:hypothetical protein